MMPISKELIVSTGLEMLNNNESLNMRKLAEKLDIKASSLYWYFKNKQELINGIALYLFNQVQVSDNLKGIDYLRCFCIKDYDVFSKNINALHYFYHNPPSGGLELKFAVKTVKEIMSMNYDVYDAIYLLGMLHHFVLQSVHDNRLSDWSLKYANEIIAKIDITKQLNHQEFSKLCLGKDKFIEYLDMLLNTVSEHKKRE